MVTTMSRTYRKPTYWKYPHRHPKTFNEIRQVSDDYNDTQYTVSTRHRYIPTAYEDITATSIYQNDYNHHNFYGI